MSNAQPKPPDYTTWRKEERRRERRAFLWVLGFTLVLTCIVIGLAWRSA